MTKILLIEPDYKTYMEFVSLLQPTQKGESFQVFRANDWNEALESDGNENYDLVFLTVEDSSDLLPVLDKISNHFTNCSVVIMGDVEAEQLIKKRTPASVVDVIHRDSLNFTALARAMRFGYQRNQLKKELDRERARSVNRAAMDRLFDMARMVAHEISSPLAVLKTALHQMESSGSPTKETQLAKKSSERLENVVTALRLYGRANKLDEPSKPVANLEEAIKATFSLCSERLNVHGVRFEVPRIIPRFRLEIDQRHFMQILLNLLQNSRDAIKGRDEQWIEVKVHYFDDHVRVSVIDSGPGVDPRHREQIMEPFFSTRDGSSALGLGLNAAKDLLEQYGGELIFDHNEPNTTFRFTLPFIPNETRKSA